MPNPCGAGALLTARRLLINQGNAKGRRCMSGAAAAPGSGAVSDGTAAAADCSRPAARTGAPRQPVAGATAAPSSVALQLKRHTRVVEEVTAPPDFQRRRLPSALRALLPRRYASDSAAKKAARRGEALVNGVRGGAETEVGPGAALAIVQRCGADPVAAAGRPGLQAVHEDAHMACVVKPQGIPTQGKGEGTVQGRIK
jgi:hypothetical protein